MAILHISFIVFYLLLFISTGVTFTVINEAVYVPAKQTFWTLFAVFPTNGNLFYRQQLLRPALDYAVQEINNQSLAPEQLSLTFIGTEELDTCEQVDSMAVYQIIQEVTSTSVLAQVLGDEVIPLAYFGPGCAKGVGDIAKWLNEKQKLPLFDAVASSWRFRNKTDYPTLIRTGYTEDRFIQFYKEILCHFGWNNSAMTFAMDPDDAVWMTIGSPISAEFKQSKTKWLRCARSGRPEESIRESHQRIFENILHQSTALVFFAHMDCVKAVLVEAVKQNLTSLPRQLTFIVNNFFDTKYWGTMDYPHNSSGITPEDQQALELAYSQTFVASYYTPSDEQERLANLTTALIEFVNANKTKYPDGYGYQQALVMEKVNPTVMGYYSAVHMYAQAMRKLEQENPLPNVGQSASENLKARKRLFANGTKIIEIIRRTREFVIPNVGVVRLDEHGDSVGWFALKSFDQEKENFTTWLSFSENDTHFSRRSDFEYDAATLPVPYPEVASVDNAEKGIPASTEIIGLACAVVFVMAVAGIVIKYYVNKAKLGSKWWVIDPTALKYLKTTDADRAISSQPHDTQTMKSEAFTFTYVTYLEEEEHAHKNFQLARYQGQIVAVHPMKRRWMLSRALLLELRDVRLNIHSNLLKFYGICVDSSKSTTVTEFAYRGSLQDLFQGPQSELDWSLRYSLLYDLLEAMIYIHKSFGYHGNLTSLKCMIDRTFVLKVTDYAPKGLQPRISDLTPWDLLWTAPELLRKPGKEKPTVLEYQKADIYSIGIILQEVILECVPYPGPDKRHFIRPPPEVIELVKTGPFGQPPYRPLVPAEANCDSRAREIMESCWDEVPESRPTLTFLKTRLRSVRGQVKGNLFDDLMERVQSYAGQLQQAVEERTQQLREEQQKIQALLYELLPKSVADRLISKNPVDPEPFDCVTIYFSDIVSFTTIAAESTAAEVVNMLNQLYHLFDGIIDHYDAYKVETIGDAYMVVSGLPKRNGTLHAPYISKLALNILQAAGNFQIPHRPNDKFKIRIGVHSGACVAGVVGNKMPRYCLFGDTVNTASRMESTSEPNRVQLSGVTARLIQGHEEFQLESRGIIDVKGKGSMETFWLTPGPSLVCYPSPAVHNFSYMRRATIRAMPSQTTLLSTS